ncbi:MAG: type I DNA topoisomerase [Flavobacteriales bacterium]|nr:type I DNA topoisomerase [Flavobacteriales bacterium]
MAKNLVIVESPAKAKTIEGFLGEGYVVKSCFGHVRDLLTKKLSVDVDANFQPTYEIPDDKKKIVSELKKQASTAELVWLATDEDREGEAISWHLVEALDLKEEQIRRIVFHEITKSAILKAIENPRGINQKLVNAQQARRVLDRLVGYEISPVLWKKVKPSLSAGRVQSVAVRLIVDREREIKAFQSDSYYKVVAEFRVDSNGTTSLFKAELPKKLTSVEDAQRLLEECVHSTFNVENLEVKPSKKSPAAPFTTSTLQQEASRKMGYSVSQTMVVAQKLYEAGKITYMRTDSVNLSDTAVSAAEDEIRSAYGEQYVNPRTFATKTKGAQEAHEAIRPTYMQNHTVDGDSSEQKLYELIWKRTIASQMSDAQLEKTVATINISGSEEKLIARGEVIKFDGFLKVYLESSDEVEGPSAKLAKDMLPPLPVGTNLTVEEINATERFTKHAARYTEASLVKKMEELGIGRPSTYAPTISTIQRREYVVKEDRDGKEREFKFLKLKNGVIENGTGKENTGVEKSKLFPADIGMVVTDFLVAHFGDVLDYNFTANVEKEFDQIAEGQKEWNEMISQFYAPFHKEVEETTETGERASGERELGVDPASGKPLIVRIGRYGAMAQIGHRDDEDKPKFASLLKEQSLETITFEEALDLFKLPRTVGEYEGHEIIAAIGRFGPYVRHDGKFFSLKKDVDDPMTVDTERAIELIEAKRKLDRERLILSFDENKDVEVLNGRYGPYIKIAKNNYKIPKDQDPAMLTLAECLEIAENAPPKKGKGFKKKA